MNISKRKQKGECPVCHGTFRLQLHDNKLYKHGHRDNPCIGSNGSPVTGTVHQTQGHDISTITSSQSDWLVSQSGGSLLQG